MWSHHSRDIHRLNVVYTSVILTLGQQRQEDLRTPKFWTSLAYTSDCRPARTTCEVVLKQSKPRKIQIYFTRLRYLSIDDR